MKDNTLIHKFFSATTTSPKIKIPTIHSFQPSSKNTNDKNNKLREHIISAIINNTIPTKYYIVSKDWLQLKKNVDSYLMNLVKEDITHQKCILKAGRTHKYDFEIVINHKHTFFVELKFNNIPQFVSPMKPSQYLDKNYEEFFYEHYLPDICKHAKLNIPDRKIYLKQIHSSNPECMKEFKILYDKRGDFYEYCKKISKKSIDDFLSKAKLNTKLLSTYLLKGQKDKHYMFYKNNTFIHDCIPNDTFKLSEDNIKIDGPNIICHTKNKMNIEIKLRWKNGNGIAFPAFQIKRKIPNVSQLKQLLQHHNISFDTKVLKQDLINLCDTHKIIY